MAEPVVDASTGTDVAGDEKYEEKSKEDSDENVNLETDSSVISGLNIAVVLSYLSLSAEECTIFEETNERALGNYDHKSKHGVSRSNVVSRKRESNEFRSVVGKQVSKDHTKTRDCRHYRRL